MLARLNFDHFAFEEYRTSASSLAVYRIVYAAVLLLVYLPQHLWISSFPDSFFNPIMSFTVLFTGFPSHAAFVAFNVAFILAACSLLIGYRTRWATVAVALLIVVGNSWVSSFGGTAGDLALLLVPVALQASGWGDVYSCDASRRPPVHPSRNAWPVAFLALLLGLAMMGAAASKVDGGWLSLRSHGTLSYIVHNYVVVGRVNWLSTNLMDVAPGVFWELLDYGTIALEGSFLLLVASRRAFRNVCAVACFFHFGICLIMEIAYWSNLLAYAAFVDWSRVESHPAVRKVLDAIQGFASGRPLPSLIGASLVLSFLYLTLGNPLKIFGMWISDDANVALGSVLCVVAVFVASRFLIGEARSILAGPPAR